MRLVNVLDHYYDGAVNRLKEEMIFVLGELIASSTSLVI